MPEESTTPDLVEVIRAMFEAGDRQALDSVMSVFGPQVVPGPVASRAGYLQNHAAVQWILSRGLMEMG